jgi:hypothetical protein
VTDKIVQITRDAQALVRHRLLPGRVALPSLAGHPVGLEPDQAGGQQNDQRQHEGERYPTEPVVNEAGHQLGRGERGGRKRGTAQRAGESAGVPGDREHREPAGHRERRPDQHIVHGKSGHCDGDRRARHDPPPGQRDRTNDGRQPGHGVDRMRRLGRGADRDLDPGGSHREPGHRPVPHVQPADIDTHRAPRQSRSHIVFVRSRR